MFARGRNLEVCNSFAAFNMKQSILCVVELHAPSGFRVILEIRTKWRIEETVMCVWGCSSQVIARIQL